MNLSGFDNKAFCWGIKSGEIDFGILRSSTHFTLLRERLVLSEFPDCSSILILYL